MRLHKSFTLFKRKTRTKEHGRPVFVWYFRTRDSDGRRTNSFSCYENGLEFWEVSTSAPVG